MHPLDEILAEDDFHRNPQQRRRSSLDNSCLTSSETFLSLLADIETNDFSQKRRRYSLTLNENKPTTFLADLFPGRTDKKDLLDLDLHKSTHHGEPRGIPEHSGRHSSKHSEASLMETVEDDSSESVFGDDDSCGTFCDAEEGEPANRSYLRQDLGASCFWDDDMYDIEDESEKEEEGKTITKSLPQANERIQAALSRVRNGKKGSDKAPGAEATN